MKKAIFIFTFMTSLLVLSAWSAEPDLVIESSIVINFKQKFNNYCGLSESEKVLLFKNFLDATNQGKAGTEALFINLLDRFNSWLKYSKKIKDILENAIIAHENNNIYASALLYYVGAKEMKLKPFLSNSTALGKKKDTGSKDLALYLNAFESSKKPIGYFARASNFLENKDNANAYLNFKVLADLKSYIAQVGIVYSTIGAYNSELNAGRPVKLLSKKITYEIKNFLEMDFEIEYKWFFIHKFKEQLDPKFSDFFLKLGLKYKSPYARVQNVLTCYKKSLDFNKANSDMKEIFKDLKNCNWCAEPGKLTDYKKYANNSIKKIEECENYLNNYGTIPNLKIVSECHKPPQRKYLTESCKFLFDRGGIFIFTKSRNGDKNSLNLEDKEKNTFVEKWIYEGYSYEFIGDKELEKFYKECDNNVMKFFTVDSSLETISHKEYLEKRAKKKLSYLARFLSYYIRYEIGEKSTEQEYQKLLDDYNKYSRNNFPRFFMEQSANSASIFLHNLAKYENRFFLKLLGIRNKKTRRVINDIINKKKIVLSKLVMLYESLRKNDSSSERISLSKEKKNMQILKIDELFTKFGITKINF